MIKLYGVALSPFVRKAMLALEFYGVDYTSEPTFPGDESPQFRAISPLGKIPVLDHDGFTIPDTSVICRYLDRLVHNKSVNTNVSNSVSKSLYPEDPQEEARACWLEEYADSRLVENCAGIFRERLLKPKMLNQPTDDVHLADIIDNTLPACLTYLESVTPEAGYLVGTSLSIADLSVVTCFLQARYGDYEVDGALFPKVRRYLDQAFAAPLVVQRMASEQANMPPGLAV